MADNTTLDAMSGGDVIATDDIGGVKYQRVKATAGADGVATDVGIGNGTAATAMRVTLASDSTGVVAAAATLAAETTKVIGTVNIAAAQTVATVTTVAAVTAITNALPAGTNAIGKLAANTGVDIGDVDVTSVIPGTTATSLGKAEDAAHASGDTGVMALSVRANTAAATSGADGDYQPLITDTNGRLHVIEPSAAAALTALQLIDNIVLAEDAAHVSGDPGVQALAVRSDTLATKAGTTGDYSPLQVDAQGALYSRQVSSSGASIDPQADDSTFTQGTGFISVIGAIAGANTVTANNAGAVSMTTTGALHVATRSQTTGGATPYKNLDVDETEDEVKATAGQVFGIHAINRTASVRYLKFYNATAASVTVGTTTPVWTFELPTQGDTNGAGFVWSIPNGAYFDTAITIAATTGLADNDTGAPGTNDVVVNLTYL